MVFFKSTDYHSVDGGDLFTGRPYGYTEEYQSYEVVSYGGTRKAFAWEPGPMIAYETGDPNTGCYYHKCPNGYACYVYNSNCTKGHKNTGTWASGYPECPHGYPPNPVADRIRYARCYIDNGYDVPGYTAPCGRRTTGTADTYDYVTRTRLATYDKQSGLFSIGIGVPYAARNTGLYSTRKRSIVYIDDTHEYLYIHFCNHDNYLVHLLRNR